MMKKLLINVFCGLLVVALLGISLIAAHNFNKLFIPLLIITGIIWCIFRVKIKKPVVYMITNVIGGIIAMFIVWLPGIKDWGTGMSFPCAGVATVVFLLDLIVYGLFY